MKVTQDQNKAKQDPIDIKLTIKTDAGVKIKLK